MLPHERANAVFQEALHLRQAVIERALLDPREDARAFTRRFLAINVATHAGIVVSVFGTLPILATVVEALGLVHSDASTVAFALVALGAGVVCCYVLPTAIAHLGFRALHRLARRALDEPRAMSALPERAASVDGSPVVVPNASARTPAD